MKKIAVFLLLFFSQSTFANNFGVNLSEISFKDSESDWIEIAIKAPIQSPIEIKDDKLITTISPNQISNEKFILIHFKSEKEDILSKNSVLHIYITKSGLTGTTEQITLESEPNIIDAVCWENSSPTQSELEDKEELIQKNAWIGDCINSEEISNKESIAKTGNSWQIFNHPTPGKENIIENSPPKAVISIQKGELKNTVPFSINVDGSDSSDPDNDDLTYSWTFPNNEILEKKNPASYRFENPGSYEITLTVKDPLGLSSTDTIKINALPKTTKSKTTKTSQNYKNGSLSNSIKINEIFPNPEGKDSNKEWIELYNDTDQNINLGNWKIDNGKSSVISDKLTIKSKDFLILEKENLNLTLKNTEEEISLIDFQGKTIDKISYTNSKSGLSYSKTIIKSQKETEAKWEWREPTKNSENQTLHELEGKISEEVDLNTNNFFLLIDENDNTHKIFINPEEQNTSLLQSLLKKDSTVSVLVEKNKNKYFLKEFEITKSPNNLQENTTIPKFKQWQYYLLFPIITGVIVLIYLFKRPFSTMTL